MKKADLESKLMDKLLPKNSKNAENGEMSESEHGLVDFSKPSENEILKSRQLIAN